MASHPLVAANGLWIGLAVVAVLFVAWVGSMLAVALDSLSAGAKIVWFVALTLLAPFAIPVYWVLRLRRRPTTAPSAP